MILNILNGFDNLIITNEDVDANLNDLGMDSVMFIQIIVALEEAFECEIPDEKLMIPEMNTVNKIFNVLSTL